MDFEIVKDLLMFLLPGGAIGSIVTWFATKKERKVDVLSKLQESIDLLTKKYTEALDENVQLKADNAKLLANQKSLEQKIDELNLKIDILTEQLKTKKQNEKSNSGTHNSRSSRRSDAHERVRSTKTSGKSEGITSGKRSRKPDKPIISDVDGQSSAQLSESQGGDDFAESNLCGSDTTSGSADDDTDPESDGFA
ncbi:MAG: hypothetical protein ACI3ZP_10890 [Candidatus Cryptobacteroides sp.]